MDAERITMLCLVDLVNSSLVNQLRSSSYFGIDESVGVMMAFV